MWWTNSMLEKEKETAGEGKRWSLSLSTWKHRGTWGDANECVSEFADHDLQSVGSFPEKCFGECFTLEPLYFMAVVSIVVVIVAIYDLVIVAKRRITMVMNDGT